MSVITKKIGKIRISEHIRSGIKTDKWYADIPAAVSQNGKRKRVYFSSQLEAETFALNIVKARPKSQAPNSIINNSGLTFSEFLSVWFEEQERRIKLKKKRSNSLKKDLGYLRSLQAFFGNTYLSKISRKTVEDYQLKRSEQKLQPTTINSEVRTLKAILNMAVMHEFITKIPFIEPLPERKKHIELPTPLEMTKIISELRMELQLFCKLMAESGCRPSEVSALRWEDFEFSDAPIFRVGESDYHTPKTLSSYREMPISIELAEKINNLPRTCSWVFPNRFNTGPIDNFRKALNSACKRANIIRKGKPLIMTPKLFRKFFGSHQGQQRLDPALLQAMMGHSPGSRITDKYYKHYSDKARRDALIKLPNIEQNKKMLPPVANKMATPTYCIKISQKADDAKSLDFMKKIGAGDEIRTHDPNLGKVMLYP